MVEARQARRSGWRGPGTAFALSLAVHAGLVAIALWLIGSPTGTVRGETRIAVTLAAAPSDNAAPVQAPRPVAPATAAPAPAATPDAPQRASRPAASPAPAAVLATEAEADDEVRRRRREALAARGGTGIAVPSHSQATPAATAGAAPAAARPGADASAQRGFVELHVLDWLATHRQYPRAARRAGLQGTVHVRFVIDPEGRIADAAVERSSGARVLDRAALDLLGRASPVPGLAQFGLAQSLELRLAIDYRLRGVAPAG